MSTFEKCIVKPGTTVDLTQISTNETFGWTKAAAKRRTEENLARIGVLQQLLYIEGQRGLNIILQATDTGGKDGMANKLSHGMNNASSRTVSFKVPTQEEKDNGFLWRIRRNLPGAGQSATYNRSQYEDVVVARVRNLVPEAIWRRRYKEINDFEAEITAPRKKDAPKEDTTPPQGIIVLKFFLHISKEEQFNRLRERFNDPAKHWKLSKADFAEREYWDEYIKAYSDAFTHCSTEKAPWFIIPADNKWMRDLIVTEIVADRLEALKMKFPEASADVMEAAKEFFGREAKPQTPAQPKSPKGPSHGG